jgi:hypothetical protein
MMITIVGHMLSTPFSCIDYLQGQVYGHPNFKDGSYVQVPNVVWDGDVEAYCSPSGKFYRLGEVRTQQQICAACNQDFENCRCG